MDLNCRKEYKQKNEDCKFYIMVIGNNSGRIF